MSLNSRKRNDSFILYSPMQGEVKRIDEIKDEFFASKLLGDGVMLYPTEGRIYAPCDGRIIYTSVLEHMVCIQLDGGVDIMIHVGIHTVKLDGEGYKLYVKENSSVKCKQILMDIDLDLFQEKGIDVSSAFIVNNLPKKSHLRLLKQGQIQIGDPIIEIVSIREKINV